MVEFFGGVVSMLFLLKYACQPSNHRSPPNSIFVITSVFEQPFLHQLSNFYQSCNTCFFHLFAVLWQYSIQDRHHSTPMRRKHNSRSIPKMFALTLRHYSGDRVRCRKFCVKSRNCCSTMLSSWGLGSAPLQTRQ